MNGYIMNKYNFLNKFNFFIAIVFSSSVTSIMKDLYIRKHYILVPKKNIKDKYLWGFE